MTEEEMNKIIYECVPRVCHWQEMDSLTNVPLKYIRRAMKEYAVNIAERAVEEDVREVTYDTQIQADAVRQSYKRLLGRIKNLT